MTAELIFELAWKSLAVAGLALLVLRMMNKRSAAERSWIANAGLIATLLLPLAVLAGPDWKVEALEPVARIVSASDPAPAMPVAKAVQSSSELAAAPAALASIRLPSLSAQDFVALVYGIPAALLTLLLIIAIFRLQLLRARAEVLVEPR